MRVVTWNIELGKDLRLVADELTLRPELVDADVILLQEMSPEGTQELAEDLGLESVFDAAASHRKTGEPFGNAILSPWPLRDPEHLLLPHTAPVDGQARSALFATVSVDGDDLVVASVHIETVLLDLRRRVEQLRPIATRLETTTERAIVGGDFNSASTRSRRAFEQVLAEATLQRLSPIDQPTFQRFRRPFVLDHLFGRGFDVLDSGVVIGAAASDHDPVWVDLSG